MTANQTEIKLMSNVRRDSIEEILGVPICTIDFLPALKFCFNIH